MNKVVEIEAEKKEKYSTTTLIDDDDWGGRVGVVFMACAYDFSAETPSLFPRASSTKQGEDRDIGGRDRTFSSGEDAILNIFYYDNGAPKSFELITEDIPNKISDVNYGIVPGAPGGACAQGSSPTGFYDRDSLCVPEEGCALRNGEIVDADDGPAGCIQFRDAKEHRSFPMKCCKQSIRRRRLWNKWGNKNTGDC